MLEQLRRQSGSFVIWVLFAIIIAAFVLFFGPQTGGGDLGCGTSAGYVMKIGGTTVDVSSWRFAMNGLGFGSGGGTSQKATLDRYQAFDFLLERAILADGARAAGLQLDEDDVSKRLVHDGNFYIMGHNQPGIGQNDDGVFDPDRFKRIGQNLGLSNLNQMVLQQKEELLANMMRQMLMNAEISEEEARAAFIQQNTTAEFEFVKFDLPKYRAALALSKTDIEGFLKTHEDEVKAKFEADAPTFQDVKPQVRVRHVFIKKAPPRITADAGAADATQDANKSRALAIHKRLTSGADFAELALAESEDDLSRRRGGDVGWRPKTALGFGKEFADAVAKLENGVISGLIETPRGFHIARVEGAREGNLNYEAKKMEIAERLAGEFYAKEAASIAAEAAIAAAKSGVPLSDLFPATAGPPPGLPPADNTLSVGPKLVELDAPKSNVYGPAARMGNRLSGIGDSADLSGAIYRTMAVGDVTDKPVEVGQSLVIGRLKKRTDAKLEEFPARKGDLMDTLRLTKGLQSVTDFVQSRCEAARISDELSVANEYASPDGKKPIIPYSPCSTLDMQVQLRRYFSNMRPRLPSL